MEKTCRCSFSKVLKWIFIVAIILFVSARIYYAATDDFRLGNITYPLPYEPRWELPKPSSEEEQQIQKILNQPFTYLGKGAQSYAFVSEDGQYVLKFFKFKHLHPSLFVQALPPIGPLKAYKEKQAARKQRKLFGVFNSYKLAYDVDKSESGLIFIQLNTERNAERSVTVIDKIGIERTIALQHYPFILQNKGETLRTVIDGLLKNQDIETAKNRLGQILELYAGEYSKGIYDHDHGVMQNTGFIGEHPIHLDVGKLMREENMRDNSYAKRDAELVIDKMNAWVRKNYPQYSEEIATFLKQKVERLFG